TKRSAASRERTSPRTRQGDGDLGLADEMVGPFRWVNKRPGVRKRILPMSTETTAYARPFVGRAEDGRHGEELHSCRVELAKSRLAAQGLEVEGLLLGRGGVL